jgi:hypothetical protein
MEVERHIDYTLEDLVFLFRTSEMIELSGVVYPMCISQVKSD